MKKTKKTPKIRFPEFTDDWEQRKVSEIGNVVTGSTPKTSISDNYGGEFLFVSPADIQGNRYVDKTITTLTQKGFDQGRKIRAKASLFVSIGSTIGKVAQTRQEAMTNQQINAVEPYDNFDDDFIFTSLENISGSIKAIASNQAVPIVNKTTFGETDIQVPAELTEQQKIGIYFKNLDDFITLQQRKLDELKVYKKGMLQKMFPKKGEKYPEIRFSGFTEAWELRKLEDIVEFLDTLRKPLEGTKRVSGPYPYYGASGIVDYVDGYLFDEELVLLSEDGANITDRNYPVCFLASGKYWVNNHAHVLKVKNGNENNFICNSLERKDYTKYNTGMAMPKLNQETCKNIPIMCPSFEEQRKIGNYFRRLDTLITLQQRKLDELKAYKKGMLQNMFV